MDRFRPNIVLEGLPAFSEHRQADLEGSGFQLRLHAPCERCVVTTIDQATGRRHPQRQPFVTLRDVNPMPGNPHAPAFAQYASLLQGEGSTMAVGQSLRPA